MSRHPDLTCHCSTLPSSHKPAQICLIERHLSVLRNGMAFALMKDAKLYINSRCEWETLDESKELFSQTSYSGNCSFHCTAFLESGGARDSLGSQRSGNR